MKKRNGFVSNSSTSSFIISCDINRIAKSMLSTVIEDFSDWYDDESKAERTRCQNMHKKWERNLEKALKKTNVKNGKVGISFPSINQNTYIVMKDGKCYVDTCNNHQWDDIVAGGRFVDSDSDEEIPALMKNKMFFNLDNGLTHSAVKFWEDDSDLKAMFCPKCKSTPWAYLINSKNILLCEACYTALGEDPKSKYKKDIKKVLAKKNKFPNPIDNIEL